MWGDIFDRRRDHRGVVCVFSILNAGGSVCGCMCVYTHTHTHTVTSDLVTNGTLSRTGFVGHVKAALFSKRLRNLSQ